MNHLSLPKRCSSIFLVALIATLTLNIMPNQSPAEASPKQELQVVSLGPRGSVWWRGFSAWNGSLKKSNQNLNLRLQPGDSFASETKLLAAMRSQKIDIATLTIRGLGMIDTELMCLQAPGIAKSYANLTKKQQELQAKLKQRMDKQGFVILNWGTLGYARLFATIPLNDVSHMQGKTMAVLSRDPLLKELAVKAKAKSVKVKHFGRVLPLLKRKSLDIVPGSAMGALMLGWGDFLKHATQTEDTILVSATVMRKQAFDRLSPQQQSTLQESSARTHAWINKTVRKQDKQAFKTLVAKGMQLYSTQTPSWNQLAKEVRKNAVRSHSCQP